MNTDESQLHYLQLLARQYPSIRAASTAIVDLNAQFQLPLNLTTAADKTE